MTFQDKSIQCFDCGATFTFSAEEKELFVSKGYTTATVPTATEMIAATIGLDVKCFLRYALNAA